MTACHPLLTVSSSRPTVRFALPTKRNCFSRAVPFLSSCMFYSPHCTFSASSCSFPSLCDRTLLLSLSCTLVSGPLFIFFVECVTFFFYSRLRDLASTVFTCDLKRFVPTVSRSLLYSQRFFLPPRGRNRVRVRDAANKQVFNSRTARGRLGKDLPPTSRTWTGGEAARPVHQVKMRK